MILCDGGEIDAMHLGIPRASEQASVGDDKGNTRADLSLDDYFRHFVISNQSDMTATELAQRLGISRKSLWERRQRMDLPRP